ncbi:MAG: UvrD-helicase domain-containing protein, partial [Pyrinomonadaceae bacterium]
AAERAADHQLPLVELLIAVGQDEEETSSEEVDEAEWVARERDAEQIVSRLKELSGEENFRYRDVAILFQSLKGSAVYEAALRRADIPYQIVQGKGFYQRPEVTDLIQLLRFLDNTSDELALAAVLRSPLCGVSDNALLALRCAPNSANAQEFLATSDQRPLFQALMNYEFIDFIDNAERNLLEQAKNFLLLLIEKRNRYTIAELLRFAVDQTEFRQVIVTNFDGPQRLANVEKLFRLAERFEQTDLLLISNFIRFVEDFEKISGRESEGEIDDTIDAVKLMTIHQSKGQEFSVVIIADLHRKSRNYSDWYVLDRHCGLTLRIPDGRGSKLKGYSFNRLVEREKLRSSYEKMRLLYVAATRARDRLILTGAVKKDRSKLESTWLGLIRDALVPEQELFAGVKDFVLQPIESVQVRLKINYQRERFESHATTDAVQDVLKFEQTAFPLLKPLESVIEASFHRFSVTQLVNFRRCPRQYFFDRVLGVTADETVKEINSAEVKESAFGLTASQKGAVIHRFCELYSPESDFDAVLRLCFEQVLKQSGIIFAERFEQSEIDSGINSALKSLAPLARTYVESDLFQRVLMARTTGMELTSDHKLAAGVYSEQPFLLRRPLGIVSGSIDKLLVFPSKLPSKSDKKVDVEIVDFKTSRFPARGLSFEKQVQAAANEYLLQMQAYALAVRELVPDVGTVKLTLHFLGAGIEVHLDGEKSVSAEECASAIDGILMEMISASSRSNFPAHPGSYCRMCNFLEICHQGREHVAAVGV